MSKQVLLTMHSPLWNHPRLARVFALTVLPMTLSAQSSRTVPPNVRTVIPAIEQYVVQQMQRNRIPGVAVAIVSNDTVIYTQGFGTDGFGASITERTGFVLGSMSKSVTALAIMQLVERNSLQLDAPVQQYLPWFRVADTAASARITVRQLLHHTSGIPTNAARATGATRTLTDQVRALSNVALQSAPGTVHEYASPNYLVLGAIIEAVAQQSYASYVQTSIFTPLGMDDSYVDQTIALAREHPGQLSNGHVYVFGFPIARTLPHEADRLPTAALISSAADMGRFLVAQLRTDSSALLSAEGLAQMHAGGAPSDGFSYAFGWRDGTIANERAVHHGGIVPNFRGKMVMLPDQRLGVVVLTNVSSAIPWPIAPSSHIMADEIAAALNGIALPVPSNKHRWLFGAIGMAMLLIIVNQLRGLWRIIRGRSNRSDSALRTSMLIGTDVVFVAAVAFIMPQLAGLSWGEVLSAAPDVGWWLIFIAILSALTVAARLLRGRTRSMPFARSLFGLAALMAFPQYPSEAQQRPQTSFDVNVGLAFGESSARFSSSAGVAADAVLSRRLNAEPSGGFVVALSASAQAHGVREGTADCVPGFACLSNFPDFAMFSMLAGWESGGGATRVLIGPAVARSNATNVGALQSRVDLTKPISNHFSLLASGRFNYIPKFDGDAFYLGSFGVGVRLHSRKQ